MKYAPWQKHLHLQAKQTLKPSRTQASSHLVAPPAGGGGGGGGGERMEMRKDQHPAFSIPVCSVSVQCKEPRKSLKT